MITAARRRLVLAWFCLLLAALPRALLPAGTMLAPGGERIALSYCLTDDGGRLLRQLGEPEEPSRPIGSGCAFAPAPVAALPVAGIRLPPSWRIAAEGLPASRARPGHPQHPRRPPSQAPPFESEATI